MDLTSLLGAFMGDEALTSIGTASNTSAGDVASGARNVLYGIMHDPDSDDASCHVMTLKPCTDEYLRRCFPATNRHMIPLAVSRR